MRGFSFVEPLRQLRVTLKDLDGWRMGVRGWLLSAIYFGYCLASQWLMLVYQRRVDPHDEQTHGELPALREAMTARRRAA